LEKWYLDVKRLETNDLKDAFKIMVYSEGMILCSVILTGFQILLQRVLISFIITIIIVIIIIVIIIIVVVVIGILLLFNNKSTSMAVLRAIPKLTYKHDKYIRL
jgi:hypothetical protein